MHEMAPNPWPGSSSVGLHPAGRAAAGSMTGAPAQEEIDEPTGKFFAAAGLMKLLLEVKTLSARGSR
jgi:hypothetical protein